MQAGKRFLIGFNFERCNTNRMVLFKFVGCEWPLGKCQDKKVLHLCKSHPSLDIASSFAYVCGPDQSKQTIYLATSPDVI